MININGSEIVLEQTLSVAELLSKLRKDSFDETLMAQPFMVVINKKYIRENQYETFSVKPGDDVLLIPLVMGG